MESHAEVDVTALAVDEADPTDAELAAYVGPHAAYYVERWSRGGRWGFNWAACFLGVLWLAYRGLWRIFAAMLAIIVAASAAYALLARSPMRDDDAIYDLRLVVGFALAVIIGQRANYWYYRRADRAVADTRARSLVEHERLALLRRLGGTSWLRVAAALVIMGLTLFAAGVAFAMLGLRATG